MTASVIVDVLFSANSEEAFRESEIHLVCS
jgi:hypothetical protein